MTLQRQAGEKTAKHDFALKKIHRAKHIWPSWPSTAQAFG
jgi:hypothetical protein